MEFLFGKRKTPEEMLRQNQRALNRAMRDLDKERQRLEQQEKKIIADIKKMAKQGQMVRRVLNWHPDVTARDEVSLECKECSFSDRMLWRSWLRTWCAQEDMSRNSSWWKPIFKLSALKSKPSNQTTAWRRPWKESPKLWPPWTDRYICYSISISVCLANRQLVDMHLLI